MTLPPYCGVCKEYHAVDAPHPVESVAMMAGINRLASLKPSPKSRESAWGWVALIVLAGIAVLSLGWCQ